MMTPSSYHKVKSDVQYTQDKTVTYLKSKSLILDYLSTHDSISGVVILVKSRKPHRISRKA